MQSGIVTCLGNQLHCSEHADVRFWRLKRALEYALGLRRLPGRIWEVIFGHCTLLGLQERGSLSTFFTSYPFIRKNYYTSVLLWNSAREELVSFLGLINFLQSSWRLPWSPKGQVSDASPSGYAVCIGHWPQQKVAQHGRILERTRF